MLFTGSGPYVVIDRRTKSDADARESSSDDGKFTSILESNISIVSNPSNLLKWGSIIPMLQHYPILGLDGVRRFKKQ